MADSGSESVVVAFPAKRLPGMEPDLDDGPLELPPNTRIGDDIVICGELGAGGMGTVYKAIQERMNRKIALKILHPPEDELDLKRFQREIQTLGELNHPNIVAIYQAGTYRNRLYYSMEFLEGCSLQSFVGGKALAPALAISILLQIARGVAAAHSRGIVHRDLKPLNVMVLADRSIKVVDFGIASLIPQEHAPRPSTLKPRDNRRLTKPGGVLGTPSFMPAEQWAGKADLRTDQYAMGVIAFILLTGRHPLPHLQGMQFIEEMGNFSKPMPSLRSAAPNLDPELGAIVDRLMEKQAEKRFPDVNAVIAALERLLPGRATQEWKSDESPYVGLGAFQEADAGRFFGRNKEIAALINRLREQALVALVGGSGVGKSSLLRAGVVPALKNEGPWESIILRPGHRPLSHLAFSLSIMARSTVGTTVAADLQEAQSLAAKLRSEPGQAGLISHRFAEREKKKLLFVVDQAEELFTLNVDPGERAAFLAALGAIGTDASLGTRCIISIRADYVHRLSEDRRLLTELEKGGFFFLDQPGESGLREALVRPARLAGYELDQAVVDDMVAHLETGPGSLPLLQHAAQMLWDLRDTAAKVLTAGAYEALGGIGGALARHADGVLEQVSADRDTAKALLVRLVTPQGTQGPISLAELRELPQGPKTVELAERLAQARLLVIRQGDEDGPTVELVHESLIGAWPTLRRWLDDSAEDSASLEQIRQAARQWQAKKRDAGLLWRGESASEAERLAKRYKGKLTPAQADFLDAVVAFRTRSARIRRTAALAAVVSLTVLAIGASTGLLIVRRAHAAAVVAEREAKSNEQQAKKNLEIAVAKERERAEAARRAEEAREEVKRAYEDLSAKNKQLEDALAEAQAARKQAEEARAEAVSHSRAAQTARDSAAKHEKAAVRAALRADKLKREAEELASTLKVKLDRERERAARLSAQEGSTLFSGAQWTGL